MTKISLSLERLLVDNSKLQDHKQQSCVIHNVAVESVGSFIRSSRADERRQQRAVVADTGMHIGQVWWCSVTKTNEHSLNRIRCLTESQWRSFAWQYDRTFSFRWRVTWLLCPYAHGSWRMFWMRYKGKQQKETKKIGSGLVTTETTDARIQNPMVNENGAEHHKNGKIGRF